MTYSAEPSRTGRSFLPCGLQQQGAAAEERLQWLARMKGFLFLVTFATSIPAFFISYAPIKDPSFILGGDFSVSVAGGALLEVILIAANLGTSLAIYPVLKGTFPALSLVFVAARILESTFIAIGIVAVMALNSLRSAAFDAGSADHDSHWRCACRFTRLDLPSGTGRCGWYWERSDPKLDDVENAPCAARLVDAWPFRRAGIAGCWRGGYAGSVRGRGRCTGTCHGSRVYLGVEPWLVAPRKGIGPQGICGPNLICGVFRGP